MKIGGREVNYEETKVTSWDILMDPTDPKRELRLDMGLANGETYRFHAANLYKVCKITFSDIATTYLKSLSGKPIKKTVYLLKGSIVFNWPHTIGMVGNPLGLTHNNPFWFPDNLEIFVFGGLDGARVRPTEVKLSDGSVRVI